ncbi:MAG: sulfate adenylyltransferase, partial [Candidatus Thorarchaeota archaeon]
MIHPHGGKLIDRTTPAKESERIHNEFSEYSVVEIDREDAQEIDNIAYGVFSPLEGFLTREDFESVSSRGRLTDDTPWTIPIVLDLDKSELNGAEQGDTLGLIYIGNPTATLVVDDVFQFNKTEFSEQVFGTTDSNHPGVAKVHNMKEFLV